MRHQSLPGLVVSRKCREIVEKKKTRPATGPPSDTPAAPRLPELGDRQHQPHQVHLSGDRQFLVDLLQVPVDGAFREPRRPGDVAHVFADQEGICPRCRRPLQSGPEVASQWVSSSVASYNDARMRSNAGCSLVSGRAHWSCGGTHRGRCLAAGIANGRLRQGRRRRQTRAAACRSGERAASSGRAE